jgi:nucleotide-binding universal stress UspA family protein
MAKINQAELTGLVILDIPGIEKSIGPVPVGGLHYAEKIEKTKRMEAADRIIQESIFYDAILIGMRTFFHFETQDSPGDSLEKILDETITPVYAVPEKLNLPDVPGEKIKVLIAFDGSLPSARALQRFAQLAPVDIFEVCLLISEQDEEKANYYLNEAEAYLKCHNVNNIQKERIRDNIKEALDQKYLDWAHVIVVGAHSKAGLFKFMVGSLTQHLIKFQKSRFLSGNNITFGKS